jgi:S-methyl-5-thioribose-1-phosphate isomerase
MRVKIEGEVQELLSVDMRDHVVIMLDQRWLPFRVELRKFPTWLETVNAIRDLVTRGAGSVGVAGGFAMAQAVHQISCNTTQELQQELGEVARVVKQARPTAVTLSAAVNCCLKAASTGTTIAEIQTRVDQAAQEILTADIEASAALSEAGAKLLQPGARILTHCNTGSLAIQDSGSALGVISSAHSMGKLAMVYVSETRPWLQGSRLTTWELQQADIPHRLVIDSACGYLFQEDLVNTVIVGADRIAANGDVANKIGTYEKAVLAHEHQVPFYVAAPLFAFDCDCPNGTQIKIEERPGTEVTTVVGQLPTGEIRPVQVAPDNVEAFNPIFDVTPASYISAYITEKGVLKEISPAILRKITSASSH